MLPSIFPPAFSAPVQALVRFAFSLWGIMLKTLLGCQQKFLLEHDLSLIDACLLILAYRSPGLDEADFRKLVTEKIPLLNLKDDSLRRKIRVLQKKKLLTPVSVSLTERGLTGLARETLTKAEKNPSLSSSSSFYNNNVRENTEKKEGGKKSADGKTSGEDDLLHRSCCQIYSLFFYRAFQHGAFRFVGTDVGIWYRTCQTWQSKGYNPANTTGLLNMYSQQAEGDCCTYANLWDIVLSLLRVSVNRPSFNTWIAPLRLVEITRREILLSCSDSTVIYWLGEHYLSLMQEIAGIFQHTVLLQQDFAFPAPQPVTGVSLLMEQADAELTAMAI